MAEKEYIEREAALKILENTLTFCKRELCKGSFRQGCIAATQDDIGNIKHIPTADVAPRAEVANKICCEIEEEIVAALESNYRALKEWDDGRCNDYILEMVNRIKGKIDALRGMEAFVEELKNKYAEVQK